MKTGWTRLLLMLLAMLVFGSLVALAEAEIALPEASQDTMEIDAEGTPRARAYDANAACFRSGAHRADMKRDHRGGDLMFRKIRKVALRS